MDVYGLGVKLLTAVSLNNDHLFHCPDETFEAITDWGIKDMTQWC